jgi:hypothetical protein
MSSWWSTVGERGREEELAMAKRILMVITPRMAGDLRSAALSAAALARKSRGLLRIITVRPIPAARVDRYDRIIADENREMARLAAAAEEQMAALHLERARSRPSASCASAGSPRSCTSEAQVFGADLIGLAAPGRPRLRHQLRAWYLGSTLPVPVVLLPSGPDGGDGRRPETVVLPAFR